MMVLIAMAVSGSVIIACLVSAVIMTVRPAPHASTKGK